MSESQASAQNSQASDREPLEEILYWYPNELVVTFQAPAAPTRRQLFDASQRLQHVLSSVGIAILPFYAGGQRVTRQSGRPWVAPNSLLSTKGKEDRPKAEGLLAGDMPVDIQVEKEQQDAWEIEVDRCGTLNRFPGVYTFVKGSQTFVNVVYALHAEHRHHDEQQDLTQIAVKLINQNLPALIPHKWEAEFPRTPPPPRSLHKQLDHINHENLQLIAHRQRLRVLAAMPNWLLGSFQYGKQPPSGPGAPPIAASTQINGTWEFKQQPFKGLLAENYDPEAMVKVIILDTCYKDQNIAAEEQKQLIFNAANKFGQNQLLQMMRNDLEHGYMTINDDLTTIPVKFRTGLDEYGCPYGYNMVDHGIFVTGIIRGILTPSDNRRIELIRIQNDYGSGDMSLFLEALEAISARPSDELAHTVLNLSLGVMPPLEQLQAIWFGSNCCCEGVDSANIRQSLNLLDLGIRLPIQTLLDQNVVIVASAGNDSLGKNPALEPRIPARYEGVLGVASVDREGEAADYSNRANVYTFGTGIATFGGEQPNSDTERFAQLLREGKITDPDAYPDAVCGLYLFDTFPALNAEEQEPDEPSNKTGWAWWSGTSFATPIISGLAAHYILKTRYRGPQLVQKLLSDLANANPAPTYERRLHAHVLEVQEQ